MLYVISSAIARLVTVAAGHYQCTMQSLLTSAIDKLNIHRSMPLCETRHAVYIAVRTARVKSIYADR